MTFQCLVIYLSVVNHFTPNRTDSELAMHAEYSNCMEKLKYYFIQGIFFVCWVPTSFLWNSTSVTSKVKANIELSSLCPLHLFQIISFLQRSLRKWERKKQTERHEAIEIVSTHCGKSQWFFKVAMDTDPACKDKKMFCQVVCNSKTSAFCYRILIGHICTALFIELF